MTILEEICNRKRRDLQDIKEQHPPRELYREAEKMMGCNPAHRSLSQALRQSPIGIIAEFKRKSPSKGWIKQDARPEIITPAYQQAGAAALSILTDGPYFGGSGADIIAARPLISLPILRKDFIIDEYQVFEAKLLGADALLLIAACLSKAQCRTLAHTASILGMETLLEIHGEEELDYICDDIDVVGVNNRDLHRFHTDIQTSVKLASQIPAEFTKISESGIATEDDISLLRQCGYNGFLIGESFMKTENPGQTLRHLITNINP